MGGVLAVLWGGCFDGEPRPPLPEQPLTASPDGAEQAVEVTLWELARRAGSPVVPGETLSIVWFAGSCVRYSDPAGCGECRDGCTHYADGFQRLELHVAISERWGERPSDTALVHELMHWALWSVGTDDRQHDHSVWSDELALRDELDYLGL
jgi:hypothetical protein